VRLRLAALFGLAAIALAAVAGWFVTSPQPVDEAVAREVSNPGDPQAGRIVFFLGGCESCHMSSGQDDPLKLGGGLELKTPFGSFFPPNISPDPVHGIGGWTAVDFANALLAGVSPNGQHYYPAFPYPSYRRMSITDVRDLFAFLRTTTPVDQPSRPHALPFPFSIRRGVGLWKQLFLPAVDHPLAAPIAPPEDRGRYLVEGPGHCVECHSPRGLLGEVISSRRLTGGPLPDGKGKAPNITSAGLSDWSESDISYALSTGLTPSGDTLGGPMAAVVRSLSQAPKQDLATVAHYLKSYNAARTR
jgi:mono/diheme cytochrome c family protein